MHAQNQNAKCVDSAQLEGSIPHKGFSASASADFKNQFSARSTADHVIAGIDLCDILRDGSGRIIILGSGARSDQLPPDGITFANLDGHRFYDGSVFYEQSKFAVALYGKELARRLRARGVAVNSVRLC
jgi:NAD(P)-dependent dehydrogenase (short-subunit alcohol dehydrogenase family)